MTDARPGTTRREPRAGADPARPGVPYIDPRTFGERKDPVGEGMSALPLIAGLLVTVAIVAGMFFLAA